MCYKKYKKYLIHPLRKAFFLYFCFTFQSIANTSAVSKPEAPLRLFHKPEEIRSKLSHFTPLQIQNIADQGAAPYLNILKSQGFHGLRAKQSKHLDAIQLEAKRMTLDMQFQAKEKRLHQLMSPKVVAFPIKDPDVLKKFKALEPMQLSLVAQDPLIFNFIADEYMVKPNKLKWLKEQAYNALTGSISPEQIHILDLHYQALMADFPLSHSLFVSGKFDRQWHDDVKEKAQRTKVAYEAAVATYQKQHANQVCLEYGQLEKQYIIQLNKDRYERPYKGKVHSKLYDLKLRLHFKQELDQLQQIAHAYDELQQDVQRDIVQTQSYADYQKYTAIMQRLDKNFILTPEEQKYVNQARNQRARLLKDHRFAAQVLYAQQHQRQADLHQETIAQFKQAIKGIKQEINRSIEDKEEKRHRFAQKEQRKARAYVSAYIEKVLGDLSQEELDASHQAYVNAHNAELKFLKQDAEITTQDKFPIALELYFFQEVEKNLLADTAQVDISDTEIRTQLIKRYTPLFVQLNYGYQGFKKAQHTQEYDHVAQKNVDAVLDAIQQDHSNNHPLFTADAFEPPRIQVVSSHEYATLSDQEGVAAHSSPSGSSDDAKLVDQDMQPVEDVAQTPHRFERFPDLYKLDIYDDYIVDFHHIRTVNDQVLIDMHSIAQPHIMETKSFDRAEFSDACMDDIAHFQQQFKDLTVKTIRDVSFNRISSAVAALNFINLGQAIIRQEQFSALDTPSHVLLSQEFYLGLLAAHATVNSAESTLNFTNFLVKFSQSEKTLFQAIKSGTGVLSPRIMSNIGKFSLVATSLIDVGMLSIDSYKLYLLLHDEEVSEGKKQAAVTNFGVNTTFTVLGTGGSIALMGLAQAGVATGPAGMALVAFAAAGLATTHWVNEIATAQGDFFDKAKRVDFALNALHQRYMKGVYPVKLDDAFGTGENTYQRLSYESPDYAIDVLDLREHQIQARGTTYFYQHDTLTQFSFGLLNSIKWDRFIDKIVRSSNEHKTAFIAPQRLEYNRYPPFNIQDTWQAPKVFDIQPHSKLDMLILPTVMPQSMGYSIADIGKYKKLDTPDAVKTLLGEDGLALRADQRLIELGLKSQFLTQHTAVILPQASTERPLMAILPSMPEQGIASAQHTYDIDVLSGTYEFILAQDFKSKSFVIQPTQSNADKTKLVIVQNQVGAEDLISAEDFKDISELSDSKEIRLKSGGRIIFKNLDRISSITFITQQGLFEFIYQSDQIKLAHKELYDAVKNKQNLPLATLKNKIESLFENDTRTRFVKLYTQHMAEDHAEPVYAYYDLKHHVFVSTYLGEQSDHDLINAQDMVGETQLKRRKRDDMRRGYMLKSDSAQLVWVVDAKKNPAHRQQDNQRKELNPLKQGYVFFVRDCAPQVKQEREITCYSDTQLDPYNLMHKHQIYVEKSGAPMRSYTYFFKDDKAYLKQVTNVLNTDTLVPDVMFSLDETTHDDVVLRRREHYSFGDPLHTPRKHYKYSGVSLFADLGLMSARDRQGFSDDPVERGMQAFFAKQGLHIDDFIFPQVARIIRLETKNDQGQIQDLKWLVARQKDKTQPIYHDDTLDIREAKYRVVIPQFKKGVSIPLNQIKLLLARFEKGRFIQYYRIEHSDHISMIYRQEDNKPMQLVLDID